MEFVTGQTFEEALRKLGDRSPVGSVLRSAEWRRVPVAIRERSFFSATVEDVRWLKARRKFFTDFLEKNTAENERGEKYLVANGRAKFIEEAQRDAIRSGMGPLQTGEKPGSLKDVSSATRLALIFDTNIKSAQDYGYWKQGMDADVLDAFPAQRFIRVQEVAAPRPDHLAHENDVRRKDDLEYWLARNANFNVPWGPWGYNSGMDVEDVGRGESDELGLTSEDEVLQPVEKDFNDQLEASTHGLDQRDINLLKIAFGDRAEFEGDTVRWKMQADDQRSGY